MTTVSDLKESKIISDAITKKEMSSAIREWHHSINEIIVHIVDYTYFYEFKNDIYIKGIWSSWSRLPFIYSRIDEYLLRTICAVASNERGTEEEIFRKSVGIVKRNIESLKSLHMVDDLLLHEVVAKLDNTETIEIQFYHLYPIIFVIKHFIVSSQLKEIFADPDAALVEEDDDSYSLELIPGIFEDRSIESPITFLQEYLRSGFNSDSFPKEADDVEFITLWLLSVASSSLSENVEG